MKFFVGRSGVFSGLCGVFERLGDFGIEHMRITQGRFEIVVIQGALHQFEVARLP